MGEPTLGEEGGFIGQDFDDEDPDDDLPCTWCGGEGVVENDDPLWYGDVAYVPCACCGGTGLRKHQTIF